MTDTYIDATALAEKFEGIKPMGAGYMVQCPTHDDKSASLKISDGVKATILYCHAGCSTDVILQKIQVRRAQLFHDFNPDRGTGGMAVDAILAAMIKEVRPRRIPFDTKLGDIMWSALVNLEKMPEPVWAEAMALAGIEHPFLMEQTYPEAMHYAVGIGDGPLFTFLRPYWEVSGRPDWHQFRKHAMTAMHREYVKQKQQGKLV